MSKTGQTLTKLRDMADNELVAQLSTTRDEAFRMKLGAHTNQVTSPAAIRERRRDAARILTILGARKRGVETVGAAAKAPAATPPKRAAAKAPAKSKAKGNKE